MSEINTNEKTQLLENWKQTLLSDILRYEDEIQKALDSKNKAQEIFNKKLKYYGGVISRTQKRINKIKLQIDNIEVEIKKIN